MLISRKTNFSVDTTSPLMEAATVRESVSGGLFQQSCALLAKLQCKIRAAGKRKEGPG